MGNDETAEPIEDEELKRQLRRQARRIRLEATLIGLALTAAAVALP